MWTSISLILLLLSFPLYESTAFCLVYSPVVGHLGCFQFEDVMSHDAKDIHMQVFVSTYVFISLG